jgi:hypothetical protein
MATWGQILNQLKERTLTDGGTAYDSVRREYLQGLYELTGRPVILYSSAWFESRDMPPGEIQVSLPDMQGFMEACSNIEGPNLDIILHSPGGSADAAESIVEYLRGRFNDIRVFIPIAAMSAATMMALSADQLVMGQHSQLGPIDPQFIIRTPEGERTAPARAIINQFERAKAECVRPENLAAWTPILRMYGPGLLTQCEASQNTAVNMVAGWLERYMLAGNPTAAMEAAKWFADYEVFGTHGRRVGRDQARAQGLNVLDLEKDHQLQDAVLSVHHATMHTFAGTAAHKIIENHHGRAWVRASAAVQVPGGRIPTVPPSVPQVPPNRSERRRQQREGPRIN